MSGIVACPWDGSQVGPVIGWHSVSAPSSIPALLVSEIKFWVEGFVGGLMSPPSTGSPAWLQGEATSVSVSLVSLATRILS